MPSKLRYILSMIFDESSAERIGQSVCEMVAIKSLSGDEALMADYVQAALRAMGLAPERDDHDNVYVVLEPRCADSSGSKNNIVHLSGHTDTVVPVEGWKRDPWKPDLDDSGMERRIVGLGTSDMKSGLAIMLHLVRHFSQHRPERLRIVISFTVCEEMPVPHKRNGVHRMVALYPGRWAITTEASCDVLSPTIALGCQGHAVAKITLQGRSAHSACPENGVNAILAASLICQRVDVLNRSFKDIPVYGEVRARAAASVTLIKGGSGANIIPEHCELTISRRIAPRETKDDVERELGDMTQNLGSVSASWTLRCDAPACCVDIKGPLLDCATQASHKIFGQARYSWNRARTDLVLFAHAGMDVINIGPGFSGQAHVAGEYVRLIDLPRSANLVAETLLRLDRFLCAENQ